MVDPLNPYSKPLPRWPALARNTVLRALDLWARLRKTTSRAAPDPAKIRRLLLIKLFGLGDLVLILPTVQTLRQAFPEASLTLLTCGLPYEVFRKNLLFDQVLCWCPRGWIEWWQGLQYLKKQEFDVVLDFEQRSVKSLMISAATRAAIRVGFVTSRNPGRGVAYTHPVLYNPDQHMVETFADIARILAPVGPFDALVPLPVSQEARSRADLFLKEFVGPRNAVIGIQAGCNPTNLSQRIWDLERFAAFADGVIGDCNASVVFTGSAEEAGLNHEILSHMRHHAVNAAGKLTMEETIALVSVCNLFLSSDTGMVHIAAAQGVPTIGLYGPDSSIRYRPFGPGNRAFHRWVPCSPCNHAEYGVVGGCAAKTCLRSIQPDEVLAAARAMLLLSSSYHPRVLAVGIEPA